MNKNLLIEIGTEELPSSYMIDLEKSLGQAFSAFLAENFITCRKNQVYLTPRRLVFWVEEIAPKQEIPEKTVKGPPVKIALTSEGKQTEALKGFLSKCQATEYSVEGPYIYAKVIETSRETNRFFQTDFPPWLINFPFEKKMRWETWQFVRPIRWIVAYYGDERIDLSLCGIQRSKPSRGLRGFKSILIESADDYFQKMKENQIILSKDERKDIIESGIPGKIRQDILWENVNRTECPVVSEANFSENLLALPSEVICTVISNQLKCFPAWGNDKLLPKFFFVMNGHRDVNLVRKGYEKVITARLNDASYFFERDASKTLIERIPDLTKMTFIEKLGTLADKTDRLTSLANSIPLFSKDPDLLTLIPLSKADLSTAMVQELTELQGTMGTIYARSQGIKREIADAISDQYHPRSENDTLPVTVLGKHLSLLDRIDTITGVHAIGMTVSSSADPLGLRRLANGLIRILMETEYSLSIEHMVEQSLQTYDVVNQVIMEKDTVLKNIQEFYHTRLKSLLSLNYRYDIVGAVVLGGFLNPFTAKMRCERIQEEINQTDFKTMCESYTRIKNITKEKNPGLEDLDSYEFQKEEEKEIWNVCQSIPVIDEFGDHSFDLKPFYRLNTPITRFFETVLVMEADLDIRNHRLQLLYTILVKMNQFADFSTIVFDGGDRI